MLRNFFGKSAPAESEQKANQDSHDIRVATCAILLEMANIDGEFSKEEQEKIVTLLKNSFQLSDEHANELIRSSKEELNGSIDLWQFTNLINQNYSRDEKNSIVEMVWKVIYSDGKLDKHEDYLVHKLGKLLRVSHKELIAAKIKTAKKKE